MKILIITDSYPPEIRSSGLLMKELAVALHHGGHEVSVVTSYPLSNLDENYRSSFKKEAIEEGIRVIRVKVISHHRVNFIVKGLSWFLMPFLFYYNVRKRIKDGIDVVILHSPPLTLSIALYMVKKRYKARSILNLHDFFPQNAVDLGILKNKMLIRFFEGLEHWAYKTSDVIVSPSHEHKKFMLERNKAPGEKIFVVPHWIDPKPFEKTKKTGKFRSSLNAKDKMLFHFGGVLGPSQGVDILIRLAEKVRDIPDISFIIAGEGTEKKRLEDLVCEKKLTNVFFRPYASKEEYTSFLKDMDVGILTLTSKNTTPAVPAKLVFYLAAGLPVLGFLHEKSEAHLIIREAQCGYSAIYDDEEACYKALLSMYQNRAQLGKFGENGFLYVEKHLTPEVCASEFEKLFGRR